MHMGWYHKNTQQLSAESQADRPWERTHLAMQRQPGGPGVCSEPNLGAHCQHVHIRYGFTIRAHYQFSHGGSVSSSGGFCWRTLSIAPQKSTSREDGPWTGVCSGLVPGISTHVLPTPHCSLDQELGQTGPGRGLPQRQSRSKEAA